VIGEDPASSGAVNVTARVWASTTRTLSTCGTPGAPSATTGFCSGSNDIHSRRVSVWSSHPPDPTTREVPVASFTHVATTARTERPTTLPSGAPVSTSSPVSDWFTAFNLAIFTQSLRVNVRVSPPVFKTTACANVFAENARLTDSCSTVAAHTCSISVTGSHASRINTRVIPVARFKQVDSWSFCRAITGPDGAAAPISGTKTTTTTNADSVARIIWYRADLRTDITISNH
jgi:hypothetical protein